MRTDGTPRLEPDPVFGPLARLLVLTGNVSAWSVSQTATLTACLRSAVMSRVPDPLPVQLDGHVDGIAHVGFLALPNVGCPRALPAAPLGTLVRSRNEHADGRVMGLALSNPHGDGGRRHLSNCRRDQQAVDQPPTRQGDRVVTVQRQQGVSHQWATRPWCRPSRVWATATPVVFDQFPAGRSEELMVAQALIAAGYPRRRSGAGRHNGHRSFRERLRTPSAASCAAPDSGPSRSVTPGWNSVSMWSAR